LTRAAQKNGFGRHQSSVHGPAGFHVPLIHTCDVYAIDAASNSNHFAFASISKMTNEEEAHLFCSHIISEAKLIHLSKSGVKGLPNLAKGLKKRGFPCTISQLPKSFAKQQRLQTLAVIRTVSVLT